MKKIITIIMLFAALGVFAQKGVAKKVAQLLSQNVTFKSVSVLSASEGIANSDTRTVVEKATFAKLKTADLTDLMAARYENIEVAVPYNGETILVQLYKVNPFSEGFHVDTDQAKSVNYEPGLYYRGIVKGDPNSVASFNFFKGELNAVISSDLLNNLVVGKLHKANNVSDYIIYSDSDMKVRNTFDCHTKDIETLAPTPANRILGVTSERCVTIYLEIDHDLYQENNSSVSETTDWLTSVFNNMQTLYTNDGITVSLKSTFIWTGNDPYEAAGWDSSFGYLQQFNEVRPAFDGDIGQLLGIDDGGLGGVATTIDGLCSGNNFSYSDVYFDFNTVPVYSWTINVITHEFGHLLGSRHTHGCYWNGNNTAIDGCGQQAGYFEPSESACAQGPIPSNSVKGTMMSYCHLISGVGINFNNGFGPQPKAAILDAVNSGTCLSTDCVNTCINAVANIAATVTGTSVTVTWTELGNATNWQVAVTPFTNNSPTWNTTVTPTFTTGGLLPNTFYKVWVRPNCGNELTGPNEQYMFVTDASWCNGFQITDTGGVNNDYTDSESYVRTIIPNLPNKKIQMTFTHFDLETDYDYLYVYDGNSTSATDLSNGGFTSNETIPGPFTSTAIDGSLTIKFFSDSGVTTSGYVANVACLSTLATDEFVPNIDFTYYPNPTNGQVTINSKTQITEVTVFNVTGQLLYQGKINDLNAKVDLSSFASGTYFFKLKFDDKEANFKIQKM
ncbi:MAG TPA: M12 family metallo-peptidase [Flavobacterium sp.]|nr:M12 family metallo-peptidase [Flavobacterium sp.]